MKKFFAVFAIILLLGFFTYSAVTIISSKVQLSKGEKENAEIVETYTAPPAPPATESTEEIVYDTAPITVDFDALREANGDVVGWLYCEDPELNYPVVQTNNNTYYLKHSFTGRYTDIGTIFVDSRNRTGFEDANTIIYGHHMPDGTMLTCLEYWDGQEYYDSHRELYLLTPQGDYRVEIVAGYTVSANSNTYTVLYTTGRDMENYLERALDKSVFTSETEADPNARYILLSTCSHKYDNARAVIHGKLVPLDSVAGVVPVTETEPEE